MCRSLLLRQKQYHYEHDLVVFLFYHILHSELHCVQQTTLHHPIDYNILLISSQRERDSNPCYPFRSKLTFQVSTISLSVISLIKMAPEWDMSYIMFMANVSSPPILRHYPPIHLFQTNLVQIQIVVPIYHP